MQGARCECRRCCIAADLPFALSEERQRQRQAFLERQRQRLQRLQPQPLSEPEPEPEPEPGPEPEPVPEHAAAAAVDIGGAFRPEPQPQPEPQPEHAAVGCPDLASTTLFLALAGAGRIDLGPNLAIHISAGAVTPAPPPDAVNSLVGPQAIPTTRYFLGTVKYMCARSVPSASLRAGALPRCRLTRGLQPDGRAHRVGTQKHPPPQLGCQGNELSRKTTILD